MRSVKIIRAIALPVCAGAAVLAAPIASQAASPAPRASTGGAQHILGSSAQLTGTVNPGGTPTSYYFQWGPTGAYGRQTPSASVGNGITRVKVGQEIVGLLSGTTYHFRIVAQNARGEVAVGHDRTFLAITNVPLKFTVTRTIQAVYGLPFVLSGTLTGLGSANHPVALQASPFPYLEPFTTIGRPGSTNAAGSFSFRVSNLISNTQFRVITLDPRPVYSPVMTASAGVRVTLRVKGSGQRGLVRLYGTVTPAIVKAKVLFQLHKAVRPVGSSEATEKFVTAFSTVTRKATKTSSRFSLVVKVHRTGRYRAMVKPPAGPFSTGYSSTVVLHAAPKK